MCCIWVASAWVEYLGLQVFRFSNTVHYAVCLDCCECEGKWCVNVPCDPYVHWDGLQLTRTTQLMHRYFHPFFWCLYSVWIINIKSPLKWLSYMPSVCILGSNSSLASTYTVCCDHVVPYMCIAHPCMLHLQALSILTVWKMSLTVDVFSIPNTSHHASRVSLTFL